MDKPKQAYVLEYDITFLNKEKRHEILYYSFEQQQSFIDKYIRLKENYLCDVDNIQTYYADLQTIDIDKIINSI